MDMKRVDERKIITLLKEEGRPLNVTTIQQKVGLGNWLSALKACLELCVEGKIKGLKTPNGWVFWVEQTKEEENCPYHVDDGSSSGLCARRDSVLDVCDPRRCGRERG